MSKTYKVKKSNSHDSVKAALEYLEYGGFKSIAKAKAWLNKKEFSESDFTCFEITIRPISWNDDEEQNKSQRVLIL